jgi:hypothetical protein
MNGEMTARLAQLRGSHAEGVIEISELAVNEVISLARRGEGVPTVQLMGDNRLEVRYGVVHARAELPVALDLGPAPRMTVKLESRVVAWALGAVVRLPFVEFDGRLVTIFLAAVPALAPYRALWPHIKSARFATAPGVLRVELGLSIDQGATDG